MRLCVKAVLINNIGEIKSSLVSVEDKIILVGYTENFVSVVRLFLKMKKQLGYEVYKKIEYFIVITRVIYLRSFFFIKIS